MTSCDDELLGIFLQNESSIKRYLQKVAGSRQDAEDLSQEAWIKLARNGSAGLSNPGGYLLRIARSVGIDYSRTNRSRLNHHDIDACLSIPDEKADPYRCVEDRDQLRHLMEIVEDLPERQRKLLTAARLEQRSHAALAKEFDISLRTVELEIRKALDYCAHRLAKINSV
ncbi:RNA polymerase sigma factor [Neorhizobium sp. DT-125]|uniref:RNA polymerase sigma factor n=1 Tax=Neorhizobium sp. DT-125 TaxID=3396163 RepID=UPI003F1CF037